MNKKYTAQNAIYEIATQSTCTNYRVPYFINKKYTAQNTVYEKSIENTCINNLQNTKYKSKLPV